MNFELTVTRGPGAPPGRVLINLGKPALNAELTRWECVTSWSGAASGSIRIYGATSLQSLSLALATLEQEITSLFPGAQIAEDGAPWPR